MNSWEWERLPSILGMWVLEDVGAELGLLRGRVQGVGAGLGGLTKSHSEPGAQVETERKMRPG